MARANQTAGPLARTVLRVSVTERGDRSALHITDCSPAVTELLGYDPADLADAPLERLYADRPATDDGRVLLETADGDVLPAVGATEWVDGSRSVVFVLEEDAVRDETAASFGWHRDEMYAAFADPERDPESAIRRALELGAAYLGMAVGFTTAIDDGTQTITRVSGTHESVKEGATCPIEEAYCRATVERDGLLCAHSAHASDDVSDAAVERFGLGSYVGKRLVVDGDLHGTVCFADPAPRWGFSTSEQVFVEALANLVGRAIERQRNETRLQRRTEWLSDERDRIRTFYSNGPLMFVRTRVDDGVVVVADCNDQFADRLGYTVEDVLGEPLRSFYAPGSPGGDTDEGRFRNAERTLVTSDGEPVHAILQAGPAGGGESETGAVNVAFLDITERRRSERELRAFREAIGEAADGVAILDGDEFVFVDRTHVEAYGFDSEDDLLGESWRVLYDDDEIARLEAEVFPTLESEGYWRGDATGTRRDGTTFPTDLSLTVVGDGRLVCTFRDETDQYERERELELKERAMDEANVAIQITDATDPANPLQYVNEQFERQTGYSAAEAVGRNPRFLQGPDTDPETVAEIRETLDDDESMTTEVLNYRKDGTPYWNRLSVTPVYDDHGTLRNYIGISQDVTERRRRADRIEKQRRRLDSVLSATGTGIAELELQSGEITWDDTMESLFGTPPPALADFFDRVHEADRARVQQVVSEIVETRETVSVEFRLFDDAGEVNWVDTRATPVVEDGEVVQLLATVTDISAEKAAESTAMEASERVRLFTENAEEYAFVSVDEDGVVDTWNAGAERLFGCDAETADGMAMGDLLRAVDYDGDLSERLRQQARIAGNSAYTGWLTRPDGSEFYAEVRYVPTSPGDGPTRFTVIVHDQTDQYRQQRRTERFVEESVDVVAIMDPDGTFEYLSGSVEQVLAYEATELCGRNAFDLIHPDDLVETMEAFFATVDDPDYPAQAEFRFRDADGEWRTLDARARNLLDDDAVGGLLVYARDISERKRRERRFEAIFNQTYQLTGVLDTDGRVLELNETALELGAFDREDVVGSALWTTPLWSHSDDGRDRLEQAVEQAADGEFARYETEILGRDGVARLDFSVKPVTDDDGDVAFLVFEGRDVTTQRRQRQHSKVLQRVLRHNIRNDLTKLYGYVELLAETDDPDTRSQHAETVESALEKWESLTENVAQIEKTIRTQEQRKSVVEVGELVSAVGGVTDELYPDAEITVTDAAAVDGVVPAAVETALLELVDNAVAASDGSEPTVDITLERPSDRWVAVHVADNGPGMPEAEAQVLEDGEETPLIHGQGLGLWLVRSVVVQAGGWVSVDVTEAGTTVTLHLRDDPERSLQGTAGEDDD